MIRRITTGLIIAGLAVAPTLAFAKVYKTQATCTAHHMVWKSVIPSGINQKKARYCSGLFLVLRQFVFERGGSRLALRS